MLACPTCTPSAKAVTVCCAYHLCSLLMMSWSHDYEIGGWLAGRLLTALPEQLLQALLCTPAVAQHAPDLPQQLTKALTSRRRQHSARAGALPRAAAGSRQHGGLLGLAVFTSDGQAYRTQVRSSNSQFPLLRCCMWVRQALSSCRYMRLSHAGCHLPTHLRPIRRSYWICVA